MPPDPTAGIVQASVVAASDAQLNDEVAPAGEPGLVGHDEAPDRHRFDGMTVDQVLRCHQQNMRRIYDQVDRELSEAWRRRLQQHSSARQKFGYLGV